MSDFVQSGARNDVNRIVSVTHTLALLCIVKTSGDGSLMFDEFTIWIDAIEFV
jgi:hypothetical protein